MAKDAVDKVLDEINKTLGVHIGRLEDMPSVKIESLHSGSETLNFALGTGGYPKGRIIEIFGPAGGGKTLMSLLAIAETQRVGGEVAFIDAEHTFDPDWARKLGVDIKKLIITQPDGGEKALDTLRKLVQSDLFDIVVLDSIASLSTEKEREASMEDNHMAVQARMLSQALKVINNDLVGKKTVVIFINQIRASLVAYGNPETTSGGKALPFYSSIRLSVSIKSQSFVEGEINGEKRKVGHTIKFRVVKSKVGPGYGEAELDVNYFTGVDRVKELFLMGIKRQVIEQNGPMYKFKAISWKGQEAAFAAIKDDKKLQEELLIAINKRMEEKS